VVTTPHGQIDGAESCDDDKIELVAPNIWTCPFIFSPPLSSPPELSGDTIHGHPVLEEGVPDEAFDFFGTERK
jgi:hypothetical protein